MAGTTNPGRVILALTGAMAVHPSALAAVSLLLVAACGSTAEPKSAPVPPNLLRAQTLAVELTKAGRAVSLDDPATCAPCHGELVREWDESMHSRAFHERDPLYGAMRSLRLGREGPELAERCASCHHPRSLGAGMASVASTGVSCATCHNVDGVDLGPGQKGHTALVPGAPAVLRGPHDLTPGSSPVHGTGPKLAALADGRSLCLACHAEEKNKAGVPTCTTGVEMADDPRSCVSCHMPEAATPSGLASPRATHRSHAFVGPHRAFLQDDPALLEAAVRVAVRFEGESALVELENRSAHGFPSGFPARMAVLVLRGLDAQGREVYRNFEKDPMAEHPEAVLNKVYRDADDQPVLAPYAVRLARDSRLKAGETRTLRVAVPSTVDRLEATLRFWLVAPPAARALGLGDTREAKLVVAARAEGLRVR
jgi:Cytochrome c554 and c-prime